MRRLHRSMLVPVAIVVVAATAAVIWLVDDDAPVPVDVTATGPRFSSFDEMVGASELVVEARVATVSDGRAITDPDDAGAGLRTSLAALDLIDVHVGTLGPSERERLVVEQEATLLDGTPLTVNGRAPLQVGDAGFFFLVRGDVEEFPYTALVNDQGFVPTAGDTITSRTPVDPVGSTWEGRRRLELVEALEAATAGS